MAAKTKPSRKFGPNRSEPAHTRRKRDPNFHQSRDVHEDRGVLQSKLGRLKKSAGVRSSRRRA